MWDFSGDTKRKLQDLILGATDVRGPHLFRYYNPKPSRVEAAEKAMGEYIGATYCLATNSCTSALVAAYRALGIGAGDEVIVPAYTFFATAATVVACNALPVIVEIDETMCLDPRGSRKGHHQADQGHRSGAYAWRPGPDGRPSWTFPAARAFPSSRMSPRLAAARLAARCSAASAHWGVSALTSIRSLSAARAGFVTTNDEWLHTRAQELA